MRGPIHDLHPSNLLSYASLFCGVAAIAAAVAAGNRNAAGALLAAAALADTFDGRFARSFKRTPRQQAVGAQLDNLVDACTFGIAPVAVFAALTPPPSAGVGTLWWLAACTYALGAITRLGFFHMEEDSRGFVGVPTPVIALIWATVLLGSPSSVVTGILFLVFAFAMVAPLPVPRPRGILLVAFACWPAVVATAHTYHLLRS